MGGEGDGALPSPATWEGAYEVSLLAEDGTLGGIGRTTGTWALQIPARGVWEKSVPSSYAEPHRGTEAEKCRGLKNPQEPV